MSGLSVYQFAYNVTPVSQKLWHDAIRSLEQGDDPTVEGFIARKVVGCVRLAALPFCAVAEIPKMATKLLCDRVFGEDESSWHLRMATGNARVNVVMKNVVIKEVGAAVGAAVAGVAGGVFAAMVGLEANKAGIVALTALETVALVGFTRVYPLCRV